MITHFLPLISSTAGDLSDGSIIGSVLQTRRTHSDEAKKKIGEANRRRQWSEESKEKLRRANLGKKASDETKLKMKAKRHSEEVKIKMSENRKGNGNSFYGKTHSNETKEKLRLANTGKKASEESRKKMSEVGKGKKRSEETKRKMSVARAKQAPPTLGRNWSQEQKIKLSGENHWNWRGGISTENEKARHSLEGKLWKDSVKNRDGNCCQKCGVTKVRSLTAHHILNFSSHIELRFAIDNGITFCINCHKDFHKKYGKKNNTLDQVEEFLKLK